MNEEQLAFGFSAHTDRLHESNLTIYIGNKLKQLVHSSGC